MVHVNPLAPAVANTRSLMDLGDLPVQYFSDMPQVYEVILKTWAPMILALAQPLRLSLQFV